MKMSQCTPRYLPLCSIPTRTNKDGFTGANAKIYLPFHGFLFASGETITFPNSTIAQDETPFLAGTTKPDTFQKDGSWCSE